MNRFYADVAERAGHHCEYCKAPEVVFNFPFEVEHIIPTCAGGADDSANMALACRSCNVFKSAVVQIRDEVTGVEVRLFHPRIDEWATHFQLGEDGHIEPLTGTGRVTVQQLRLNVPAQLEARRHWQRLGVYPG